MSGRRKVYATEQEAIDARRARHRARYAAMSPEQKREYARRKNGRRKMPQMVIERGKLFAPHQNPEQRQSVDEFLSLGGRIERIPVPWDCGVK